MPRKHPFFQNVELVIFQSRHGQLLKLSDQFLDGDVDWVNMGRSLVEDLCFHRSLQVFSHAKVTFKLSASLSFFSFGLLRSRSPVAPAGAPRIDQCLSPNQV